MHELDRQREKYAGDLQQAKQRCEVAQEQLRGADTPETWTNDEHANGKFWLEFHMKNANDMLKYMNYKLYTIVLYNTHNQHNIPIMS